MWRRRRLPLKRWRERRRPRRTGHAKGCNWEGDGHEGGDRRNYREEACRPCEEITFEKAGAQEYHDEDQCSRESGCEGVLTVETFWRAGDETEQTVDRVA
jgi:hypothetical protein